ncbi:MAG TPA: hypothetical protein VK171_13770 [Fimbriimonas sp.]|nr:hypothetical protein [Fimbriimonas sp.]
MQAKPIELEVSLKGQKVGSVRMNVKITAEGSKRSESKIELKSNGETLNLQTTDVWDNAGRPVMKLVAKPGKESVQSRVNFSGLVATVQVFEGEKQISRKLFTAPKGIPVADLSEFWILRDLPAKGAKVSSQLFNPHTSTWDTVTSTYIGFEKHNGAPSHKITKKMKNSTVEIWLDTQGLPLEIKSSDGTVMIRK